MIIQGNVCIQGKFSKSRVITLDTSRVTTQDLSRVNPGFLNSTAFVNPGNIVEIGRGSFGRVYKAELANTGLVALKSFVDEYSNIEEDELKRIDEEFVNELELLHEVDCHQNVNHILGITKVSRSYILRLAFKKYISK
ncbi:unnamed protein product [Rhizophagus irregularis]|uniref:Protein kinase domain-containing protein n=1 Tax=Rhizophagus irregularis TaxID=588596 RepID=A0A915ZGJ0_9GLOM|nr:unnamed protein product [Rhizophagus irregularis]